MSSDFLHTASREEMLAQGFHPDFSSDVQKQLASLHANSSATKDLRSLPWSSIDNDTSRDLDQIEYAEQLPGGYPAFLEMSLVNWHAANSHEVFAFTDLKSGCTALNDKAGYSTSASFGIDGCEYGEEVGSARVGSPFLVAINDVVITVA